MKRSFLTFETSHYGALHDDDLSYPALTQRCAEVPMFKRRRLCAPPTEQQHHYINQQQQQQQNHHQFLFQTHQPQPQQIYGVTPNHHQQHYLHNQQQLQQQNACSNPMSQRWTIQGDQQQQHKMSSSSSWDYSNEKHIQHLQFLRSFTSSNSQSLITVHVIGTNGKRMSLCVDKNDAIVHDLKQLIFGETLINAQKQVLLYEGKQLKDSDNVRDTTLHHNSVLQLVTPFLHKH